jgi:hypothetical protein
MLLIGTFIAVMIRRDRQAVPSIADPRSLIPDP